MKLSVIIPAFKEPYLQRTIDSFLDNSALDGEVEVIAVIDGPWMPQEVKADKRVKVIQAPQTRGMRASINAGLEAAQGEYVLKADAHCAFGLGFDKIMVENCEPDWLAIPRMYALNDALWEPTKMRWPRDHHYLQFPVPHGRMAPYHYRPNAIGEIVDTMSFQGSCWLAHRETFMKRVGFLDDNPKTYGSFAGDQLEIGLKYWLGGGEVKVNRKAWYAHLWKMPRHYATPDFKRKSREQMAGWPWATAHWFNNEEPGMVHKLSWLIEKFWPIPGWPEDWERFNVR